MNAIHRIFSFLLCATTAMLWLLASAYAQSKDTKTCAMLAASFTRNVPMQIKAADQLHQMIQRKIYAACLQTRGKQGASRMTSASQVGTNTTKAGAFVTFDVPGSTLTNPAAINNPASVAGHYIDAAGLFHSFLRTSDGTITPFDPPGIKCDPLDQAECSDAFGITPDGTIVGGYAAGPLLHGYLRAPNGTFTVFDPPGSQSTNPAAINPAGAVTGYFFNAGATGVAHGFLRAPNGTFTTFDPRGATVTIPTAINPAGTITGQFFDVTGVEHGFLRTSGGTISVFDPPGSLATSPNAINPAGTIVGSFSPDLSVWHGFLRAPNGTFTEFDASAGNQQTLATGINPAGTIVGSFLTADFSAAHGFLRASNGTITVFDPPGSQFTGPAGINPAGTVTGDFVTPDFTDHGFVVRPKKIH
jgi:uncharacterized membrane protein